VALAVARAAGGSVEIVSADSMQVYRGMDIGTAKPTAAERAEVAHHLIDIVDPAEEYSVVRFQADVTAVLADIDRRGRRALIVGGTGLYLRALVDGLDVPGRWPDVRAEVESVAETATLYHRLAGLDPIAAGRMESGNRRRIIRALEVCIGSGRPFSSFGPGLEQYPPSQFRLAGIAVGRAERAARIEARFATMLDAGLLDEVRALAVRPQGLGRTARQALGYRELLATVEDGASIDDGIAEAIRRTRRFARRQEVWFRRDPRIVWYEGADNPLAVGARVLGDWQAQCRP